MRLKKNSDLLFLTNKRMEKTLRAFAKPLRTWRYKTQYDLLFFTKTHQINTRKNQRSGNNFAPREDVFAQG